MAVIPFHLSPSPLAGEGYKRVGLGRCERQAAVWGLLRAVGAGGALWRRVGVTRSLGVSAKGAACLPVCQLFGCLAHCPPKTQLLEQQGSCGVTRGGSLPTCRGSQDLLAQRPAVPATPTSPTSSPSSLLSSPTRLGDHLLVGGGCGQFCVGPWATKAL